MSFDPTGLTVYVDGDYVDGAEARVPLWDHGVLYGDGIFEGMRLFSGSLFRPYDHLARLERSARSLGLELPLAGDAAARRDLRGGDALRARRTHTSARSSPAASALRVSTRPAASARRSSSPPTRSRRCSGASRSRS